MGRFEAGETGRGARAAGRRRSRAGLLALGLVGLLAGGAGALILADRPPMPPARPAGAGLVPEDPMRTPFGALPPSPGAPAGQAATSIGSVRDAPAAGEAPPAELAALQEASAAEARRLAELRDERAALEAEVAALRLEALRRQREMPGRKALADDTALPPPPRAAPQPALAALPPAAEASRPAAPEPSRPAAPEGSRPAAPEGSRPARVFVHHRAGAPGALVVAEEVAAALRGAGAEVAALRATPFAPSTPVIRYFHDEDGAAAARLAGRLGPGWAIQDFRAYSPLPPPRTLEVWLPTN